jgi:hypothetical protein
VSGDDHLALDSPVQFNVDLAHADARSSQEIERRGRDLPRYFHRLRVREHDLGRRCRVLELVDRFAQVPCRVHSAVL